MSKRHNNTYQGMSVIEVLIAAAVIAISFISLYSLNNQSIRTSTYSRNQTEATGYSNQVVDWLRNQRTQLGWTAVATKFVQDAPGGQPVTYCVPTLPADAAGFLAMSPGNCNSSQVIPGTSYTRTLVINISMVNNNSLAAMINTTWPSNTTSGATVEVTLDKTQ